MQIHGHFHGHLYRNANRKADPKSIRYERRCYTSWGYGVNPRTGFASFFKGLEKVEEHGLIDATYLEFGCICSDETPGPVFRSALWENYR